MFWVWTCAHGYFHPFAFIIYRVIALDFVKIWNFQFVSRVTLKPLPLQTWNFRYILFRVWTWAPGYFHQSGFNIDIVMGLDFVKIWKFQFVSRITLKPMVLHTWNFRNILFRACTCAPGYFHPSNLNIDRVMGLDFYENMEFSVCVALNSKTISTADLKLQGYIIQGVNLCTWVFLSIWF